jgi:hypothetical protein
MLVQVARYVALRWSWSAPAFAAGSHTFSSSGGHATHEPPGYWTFHYNKPNSPDGTARLPTVSSCSSRIVQRSDRFM